MTEVQMQATPPIGAAFLTKLVNLALAGLAPLYDDRQKLFAYRIQHGHRTPMPLAWSITYTAITLLGLIRARQHGWHEIPVDEAETVKSLILQMDKAARAGDLGLMLWADAMCDGHQRQALLGAVKGQARTEKLARMTTMELAWILTGLCYSCQRSGHGGDSEKLALTFYEAMVSNLNPDTGLLCHRGVGRWPAALRYQVGNFADQIYAVYALSTFYEVFGRLEALQWALQCAHRLCGLQGDQGQWWWHYHAPEGVVASRYPVFAVHQDGMAPMALLKLSAVSDQEFHPAIQRGLAWLCGANALGVPIIDWDQQVVWREIKRRRPAAYLRYVSMTLTELGGPAVSRWLDSMPLYELNREMRPYHLGWLLYAFTDQRVGGLEEGRLL